MSRRLAVLFLLAVTTVLVAIGVVAASLGPWVLPGYLFGLAILLVLQVRQARAARRRLEQAKNDGRTCSCCTSTVFDPIEIR